VLAEIVAPIPAWARVLMVAGPLVLYGLAMAGIALSAGRSGMLFVLGASAAGFLGAGKLVILAGAVEEAPVGMLTLAALVVFGDLGTALVMMAVAPIMYRIPHVGQRLAHVREAGIAVLTTHPWMRRAAWTSLAAFVAIPFQGTGAVVGVVLGRILGLSRFGVITAVGVGSMAGASAIVAAGSAGGSQIAALVRNPVLGGAVVVASVLAMYLMGRWLTRRGAT
jgi:hypothetical protein